MKETNRRTVPHFFGSNLHRPRGGFERVCDDKVGSGSEMTRYAIDCLIDSGPLSAFAPFETVQNRDKRLCQSGVNSGIRRPADGSEQS